MKKGIIIISSCAILGITLYVLFFSTMIQKTSSEETDLDFTEYVNLTGEINVVEQEEYHFFYEMISKNFEDRTKQETIHEETTAYIQDIYSQFLIGNHLGVGKPYSFQTLTYEMEQENLSRKLKDENNEVFYGPVQYQLDDYFKYTLNNTKLSIVKKLSEDADDSLIEKAREYYESYPEKFSSIEAISYEINRGGVTEQKTVYNHEMSTMEKVEPELFQIIYESDEGVSFEIEEFGEEVTGKVLAKSIINLPFDELQQEVLKVYITKYVYDDLVAAIGKENPIKLDIE